MTTNNSSPYPAKLSAAVVILLAGINWYLQPDKAVAWGGVSLAAFVAIIASALIARNGSAELNRNIGRGLFGGALILSVSLAIALAGELSLIGGGMEKRAAGILLGSILIVTGNFLPKTVRPLSPKGCDPARLKATERFAGWVFVLAGFIYVGLWLIAPVGAAQLYSSLIGLGAFVLVMLAWFRLGRGRPSPNQ